MSIIYCELHDLRWDSDRKDECPACENEPPLEEQMNKSDLITDARNQITLAKINLMDNREMAALDNLRSATLQIVRFNNLLRKPKRTVNVVAKNRSKRQ